MPKTLADARTRISIMTVKPAKPRAATVAELTAGIDASCRVLKDDYRMSATASDTVPDAELCSEGNAVTFGASNYEGSITPFWYLDDTGKPVALEDVVYQALKKKGTMVWIAEREGPRYDDAWVLGDNYELYEVVTDNPQKPSTRGGYIKRTIPLGVQRAYLDGVVAA